METGNTQGVLLDILEGLESTVECLNQRIDTLKTITGFHTLSRPSLTRSDGGTFESSGLFPPFSEIMQVDPSFAFKSGFDRESTMSREGPNQREADRADGIRRRLPTVLTERWGSRTPHAISDTMRKSTTAASSNTERRRSMQVDSCWREIFVANEVAISVEKVDKRPILGEIGPPVFSLDDGDADLNVRPVRYLTIHSLSSPPSKMKHFLNYVPFLPNSAARIFWDCMGIICMLYDCVTIPVFLCWGYEISPKEPSWYTLAILSLIFWTCDIVANFNTGVLRKGTLDMRRSVVGFDYLSGWFILDFALVVMDVLMIFNLADVGGARAFRTTRLLRVFKVYRVNQALDDLCGRLGIRWIVLIVTIVGNLFVIFLIAHLFTCLWYFLGKAEESAGRVSWIDLVTTDDNSLYFWYTKSLYFVLGHLTAAPVDPLISPVNNNERLFTLFSIFCSILVVGSGISSMTNTIAELGKLNSGFHDTKRALQSYLKTAHVNGDLYYRILKFAMHSYSRQRALRLDMTVLDLLSDRLKSELALSQRSSAFTNHLLFSWMQHNHSEVFRDACQAFHPIVLADEDVLFHTGRISKCMFVTEEGEFQITGITADETESALEVTFTDKNWISELALYTKFVHQSTFSARSFADAWTLSCADFIKCVGTDPTCVAMVYRYAQEFLKVASEMSADIPIEVVGLDGASQAFHHYQRSSQPLWNSVLYSPEDPEVKAARSSNFLERLRAGDMRGEVMLQELPKAFVELNSETGIYAKLEFLSERNRACCSMISIFFMMHDRYEDFTQVQTAQKMMTETTWRHWQNFIKWAHLGSEEQHALLVFLAIRGLGKVKALGNTLPQNERSPEDIVLSLMSSSDSFVPSFSALSPNMKKLVELTFSSLKGFSLPQLLQGENTPSQIMLLQQAVDQQGEHLLRFFLVCQVSIMCGLSGATDQIGSHFMDEKNSLSMLTAISCLRQVQQVQCHTVYWTFILSRAACLGLPSATLDQVALARLACLCRITEQDHHLLEDAWNSLNIPTRSRLRENFLADGITEVAYVFTFLPLYLANAKENPSVGWKRAFQVLYELMQLLHQDGCEEQAGSCTIVVNLSDVAHFARAAASHRLFLLTPAHIRIVQAGPEIQLLVTTAHKESVPGQDSYETHDLIGTVRALVMKVDGLEQIISGTEARRQTNKRPSPRFSGLQVPQQSRPLSEDDDEESVFDM
mmetsp:Transcript_82294/g.180966  ORF Transcript_82294/g.180966 Transcript_82294/m.180966 type:complete len:1206 (+) Transcript_82294:162-3779(+)